MRHHCDCYEFSKRLLSSGLRMSKSSKLEDYWKKHGIENLFKELTHVLVQRMPADPVLGIVQHLQKKFPNSFKNAYPENSNTSVISKTMAQSLQARPADSSKSDIQSEANDFDLRRRSLNQSQISSIVAIPTTGSAFTNLVKTDMSSSKPEAPLSIRQLLFANRVGRQAVKLGKNIQTDHDIIEEELIKPTEIKSDSLEIEPIPTDTATTVINEDLQTTETHDQPRVVQLVKYKQQIRTENDRRLHRQKLAELALAQRSREELLLPDAPPIPQTVDEQEMDQTERANEEPVPKATAVAAETTNIPKPTVTKTKEEEEILNDENVFQTGKARMKTRHRRHGPLSSSNTPRLRENPDIGLSTVRRLNEQSAPIMQFSVCKKCGEMINDHERLPRTQPPQSQTVAIAPTQSIRPPMTMQSPHNAVGESVDDWFESASNVSGPREMSPWTPDDNLTSDHETHNVRRNLFQPIQDHPPQGNAGPRTPKFSFNPFHDRSKMNVTSTPRMSETGRFTRSPETKIRRTSLSRNVPSPVIKTGGSDSRNASRIETPSPLFNAMPSSGSNVAEDRRMSGWSVQGQPVDESDEN